MKQKTNFLKAKVEVKQNGDVITVVASDETLDRHGEVLPIEAWDLSKFKVAPRMLVDHDHQVSSIVGKWGNVRVEGKQLMMDAIFHDITQLAREVKEMVVQNFLDTVSVGFIWNEKGEGKDARPSFELIETSWVTVPANPAARVQHSFKSAMAVELTDDEKVKIKEFAGEIEESDDILPEEDQEAEPTPSESPVIVDMTPEAMEKMGWKVVSNTEDFNEWQFSYRPHGIALTLCDTLFLTKLLERSEQLETLTQENKARSDADQKAKLVRLAFKEAAGQISHALREANKLEA